MARKVRIEFPGACYHVINRGNFRSRIFETQGARGSFLECLQLGARAQQWRLHAWCLMGNHYHLVIETPQANLVAGMKWVQSTFANRFNRFGKTNGHVFQGRYRAIVIEKAAVGNVCHYVHLNPARAGLVPVDRLQDYLDSSFHQLWYPRTRWEFCEYGSCLRTSGGFSDSISGRRAYRDFLKQLSTDKEQQEELEFDSLSRGWAVGTDEFKQEVLANCEAEKLDRVVEREASQMREPRWESGLSCGLTLLGRDEVELAKGRKGEPWKVALARHLRERHLAPHRWISERLHMGKPSSVQSLVSRHRQQDRNTDGDWEILKNHE